MSESDDLRKAFQKKLLKKLSDIKKSCHEMCLNGVYDIEREFFFRNIMKNTAKYLLLFEIIIVVGKYVIVV